MEDQSYEFEVEIDRNTKIKCFDFSLKCSRSDVIIIWILRKVQGKFEEMGSANLVVESPKKAHWADLKIGSDAPYLDALGLNTPNPEFRFLGFRGKGIGSKVVQVMLSYLKENGIDEVYGEISNVDDVERASNFWKKNGFTVIQHPKSKGNFVARIEKRLM